ncbi:MAG TPA: OmpA family protein [Cyclobacteriaceae bacterium]|nr:OmpA family protein [Cyclobacteriaceae bacterium]HMV07674.1 OmpA family protein [Cyclobacteriaceae bacterium]HMV88475.1 OmpA family protein [Cyclobacteriaceae bacterium]HMW98809.1 OmpA family protein [Cyclobacteriaceae bacterium]HMX48558.1 OmpA family protein [Cyclobacteriaceae bacterium]
MLKRTLILLAFVASSLHILAQSADSTVVAQGKVVNAETKEPITARITYQSLPYGNKMGVINNSTYSFPMFDRERYSISVDAPGYLPAKFMLDPAEATNLSLVKDIELTHGEAHAKKKHAVGHVMVLNNLIFEVNKNKIDPDSYPELDIVVNMMRENPNMVIQLEGHTDFVGNPEKLMKLSQDRVDAVKSYLTSKKVNKNRIKTKAFGGTAPLSRDDTPEAHRMNRRVELRILEN